MFVDYLPRTLPVLILILLVGLILRYKSLVRKVVRRNIYVKIALIFFTLFFIGTIGTYFFERKANENFINIYQSFWSSIVYLLSGFEAREPITIGGRVMSLIIFIASICVIGSVAGNFASVFIKRGEVKMPREIKGHIAICNWNDGGDRIVKELHSHDAAPDTDIIVLTNNEVNESELRKSSAYEKVYFIRSDPTLHDTIRASRVHLAKSVVILADKNSPQPDADSALICLAIRKLADVEDKHKPHIVIEAINHRKIEHLKDAGADEVICATDYGLGILSQCTLYTKLSDVYQQLLSYGGDTNEIYVIERDEVSKAIKGKDFGEVAEWFAKNRDPNNPAILIGVRRKGQIILNPREKQKMQEEIEFNKFLEGDGLIVMAFEYPDLSKLIAK